jgi:hypothetical protein
MLQETAKRLLHDRWRHRDGTLKNATVESCVLHARVLTEFIYPPHARSEDVHVVRLRREPGELGRSQGQHPGDPQHGGHSHGEGGRAPDDEAPAR